jgi:hypothetical protein
MENAYFRGVKEAGQEGKKVCELVETVDHNIVGFGQPDPPTDSGNKSFDCTRLLVVF